MRPLGTPCTVIKTEVNSDLQNKINKCSHGLERANNLKTTLKKDQFCLLGGIAATAAATAGVAHSSKAQQLITKGLSKLTNTKVGTVITKEYIPFIKDIAKTGINAFKALPSPAKAVAIAGAALIGYTSSHIRGMSMYKQGQIDQKYSNQ